MQHEDPQRAAVAERKRRRREDHLAWKALTFVARPPPPFVHVEEDEDGSDEVGHLAAPSAGLIARIRKQPFAMNVQQSSSAPRAEHAAGQSLIGAEGTGDGGSGSVEDGNACATLTPLERRLKLELANRQPLLDPRRTAIPQCTMAVFALPAEATEDDLRRFGERFGRVAAARLVRNVATGASRRYGFVQFSYARELEKAVRECTDPLLPRPRIRNKLVVVEAERARIDSTHVPARLVRVRDKTQGCGATVPGVGPRSGPSGQAVPQTAEAILDNIDEYLLSL